MNTSERILVKILAHIQLRVMAKRQSGLIKPDSIDQHKPGEINKMTHDHFDVIQNYIRLEKADKVLR